MILLNCEGEFVWEVSLHKPPLFPPLLLRFMLVFIYCPAAKIKMTWSLCAAGRQQQISARVNETATL